MLDRMSDTSRIVDRLVTKQLVKKVVCAKDRRLVDVTITEKGQSLLKKLDSDVNHIEDLTKNLTEEEAKTISELLDKLREGKKKINL
jgi:DNA-binding MarR family transcriptional regulator